MSKYNNFIGIDFPYKKATIALVVKIIGVVAGVIACVAGLTEQNYLYLLLGGQYIVYGFVIATIIQYLYDIKQLKEYQIQLLDQDDDADK